MVRTILQHGPVIVSIILCLASAAWAEQGPLPMQNRFPLHLLFLTPRPVSAVLPDQGTVQVRTSLDYSRINMQRYSDQWEVIQDMEIAVLEFSFKYALSPRMALRLDIPVASMNSGFMDHYVNGYHDALDVPADGPENVFVYEVSKNWQLWFEGESGLVRVADMTLSGQFSLLHNGTGNGWFSSLMASVKLPTGDPRRGYGSGRVDAGLFLPCEHRGVRWAVFFMPGMIFPSDPDGGGGDVHTRTSLSLFAGTAYAHSEKWQWLLQGSYFSSPLEYTGIDKIDDGAFELVIGLRYSFNRHWCYEFGFSEDIFTRAAPDFTLHSGVVWTRSK